MSGMYSISIVAKSGNPVFGQTLVNSVLMWLITKFRFEAGLGKVSIVIVFTLL